MPSPGGRASRRDPRQSATVEEPRRTRGPTPPRTKVAEREPRIVAITNALKLGTSLVATLAIAITMRFLMPRLLGPTNFGTLSYADGFTATFFVAISLGAEAYVRKEVSVRPAHASDFLGGTLVLRVWSCRS